MSTDGCNLQSTCIYLFVCVFVLWTAVRAVMAVPVIRNFANEYTLDERCALFTLPKFHVSCIDRPFVNNHIRLSATCSLALTTTTPIYSQTGSTKNSRSFIYYFLNHHLTVVDGRIVLVSAVIGCPQLVLSNRAWVRNTHANDVMIRCNDTMQTWYLSCQGNRWVGRYDNCTGEGV